MLTDFLLYLSFCHTLIVVLLACPLLYLLASVGFCWIDRSHGNIDWPRVPWGWEFSDCHRWEQLQIFSSSFCKTPLSETISTHTRFWENVLDEKETMTKQLKSDSRDRHSCFLSWHASRPSSSKQSKLYSTYKCHSHATSFGRFSLRLGPSFPKCDINGEGVDLEDLLQCSDSVSLYLLPHSVIFQFWTLRIILCLIHLVLTIYWIILVQVPALSHVVRL